MAWIPYCERPDWKDVTPLPQDEDERAILRIAYTDKFRDIHDFLRAVMKSDERSERVLELTKDAVLQNPANYTSWAFRRRVLEATGADLSVEGRFVETVILDNQKNYQVWYHRRWVAERLGSGSAELDLTRRVLEEDAKNYHAWEHRQWALRQFSLWEQELAFTELLIGNDVRNNSAWHQRHFVISQTTGFTQEVRARELDFVQHWIKLCPNNESSWAYLRGLYLEEGLAEGPLEFVRDLCAQDAECSHLLAFLHDCLVARLDAGLEADPGPVLQECSQLLERLGSRVDPVRCKYWAYLARDLALRYGVEVPSELS